MDPTAEKAEQTFNTYVLPELSGPPHGQTRWTGKDLATLVHHFGPEENKPDWNIIFEHKKTEQVCINEGKRSQQECEDWLQFLCQLPAPEPQPEPETPDSKKRRRMANEIDREFKCEMYGCFRAYGTRTALKKHISSKHPELMSGPLDNFDEAQDPARGGME